MAGELRLASLPLSLQSLDRMPAHVLVLPLLRRDRPLPGAAGLADWRLNGRLSRLVQAGAFRAEEREALLTDSRGRIGAPILFLFGLGESGRLDRHKLEALLGHLAGVVARARWQSAAIEAPARRLGSVDADEALALWLSALAGRPPPEGVVLLRSSAAQEERVATLSAQDKRIQWRGPLVPAVVRA